MAQYLYKTTIFTDDTNVIGLNASQNTSDVSDYETNHQSSTTKITDIQIAETTFKTEMSYTDFDTMIVSPYSWSDVKELHLDNRYELYLVV